MQSELFNVTEVDVAKKLGLSRDAVRKLRAEHLYQDEDFGKVGRDICYTEEVVQKLRQVLQKNTHGIKPGDLVPMSVKTEPAASDGPTVIQDAVVTEVFHKNTQHLRALLGGRKITVRVRNNANFIAGSVGNPGTVIPASKLAMRNPLLYDFIGQYPRARGMW